MNTPGFLPKDTFRQVVRSAPLVSLDLLVFNPRMELLLGWRSNMPARDTWFVPGGRILKNESIRDAFSRIAMGETGIRLGTEQATFHGVFEHFHPVQNFADEEGYGTHYVVLAFEVRLSAYLPVLPLEQHTRYKWLTVPELLRDERVHPYTRNYFNGTRTF